MRPVVGVAALVCALVVVTVAAGHPGAHANHVHADAQVIANGQVVIEEVFPLDEMFLVIHVDDDGNRGTVLGWITVGAGQHNAVEVTIEESVDLADPTMLQAVLYRDENADDEFDRDEDTPLRSLGNVVADRFAVRQGDQPVRVIANDGFGPQAVEGPVRVPLVAIDRPGYVVIRADVGGAPARILGVAELSPGRHEDVVVSTGSGTFAEAGPARLWAIVYADNGDGEFDPDEDQRMTVGDHPVASVMAVDVKPAAVGGNRSGSNGRSTTTPDSTPTTTAGDSATTTPRTTQTSTAGGPTTTTTTAGPATTQAAGDATQPTIGFGMVVAMVGLLALLAVRVLSRR